MLIVEKNHYNHKFFYVTWCCMLSISAYNPKEIFILLENPSFLKNELESYLKNEKIANN